jgi:hypothetical protein
MGFQEKSAWVMSLALLVGGVFYFGIVAVMSSSLGHLAPPVLPLVAVYSAVLVLVAIVGHVVAALSAPGEADAGLDERDRLVGTKASHRSGLVFASGVVVALGAYLFSYDGDLLFYGVFASLMLSQLVEYAMQIVLYRTRV